MQAVRDTHVVLAYVSSSPAQKAFAEGLIEAEVDGFWEENCRDVYARVNRMKRLLEEIGLPVYNRLYAQPGGFCSCGANAS